MRINSTIFAFIIFLEGVNAVPLMPTTNIAVEGPHVCTLLMPGCCYFSKGTSRGCSCRGSSFSLGFEHKETASVAEKNWKNKGRKSIDPSLRLTYTRGHEIIVQLLIDSTTSTAPIRLAIFAYAHGTVRSWLQLCLKPFLSWRRLHRHPCSRYPRSTQSRHQWHVTTKMLHWHWTSVLPDV